MKTMEDGIEVYLSEPAKAWMVGDLRAEIADLADDVRLCVFRTDEAGREFLIEQVVLGTDRAISPAQVNGHADDLTSDCNELQLLCNFPSSDGPGVHVPTTRPASAQAPQPAARP